MKKRYQVFISSTFQDLEGARQEVSQALLRADCFPAGMELFPAADEETFEYIKEIIRESDYYIIISAGRYGSIPEGGDKSYTEMEYDYAIDVGKPVIRLLHKDPFNRLTGDKIEHTDAGKAKLRAFHQKLTNGVLVNFWEDPKELGQLVVFGLMDARKRKPAIGWVRAEGRASLELEVELAQAKQRIAELELEHAGAAPDFEAVFAALEGEATIVTEEYTDHYSPEPTGKTFTETLSASELAVRVCVAMLEVSTTYEVSRAVIQRTQRKADFGHTARSDFKPAYSLTALLQTLDHKLIVNSEPFSADSAGVRQSGQLWFLADESRTWISGIAANDDFI